MTRIILTDQSQVEEFDVFPLVTHCALDIICETAMGKSVGAQEDSDSDYVRAIYSASDIVFNRQMSPWLWNDLLFSLTPMGFKFKSLLEVLHTFTDSVIRERKEEHKAYQTNTSEKDDFGMKKKQAFLDLLISASEDGGNLSDRDMREEVDTFMFEGTENLNFVKLQTQYLTPILNTPVSILKSGLWILVSTNATTFL